jgi:hypothetical protein
MKYGHEFRFPKSMTENPPHSHGAFPSAQVLYVTHLTRVKRELSLDVRFFIVMVQEGLRIFGEDSLEKNWQ